VRLFSHVTFEGGSEAGLDASETYTLDLTGFEPHPQQGWHVKLTVNNDGSQGADVNHKVFWVTGCETPPPHDDDDDVNDHHVDDDDVDDGAHDDLDSDHEHVDAVRGRHRKSHRGPGW
jgi:hypothetical protein